MTQRTILVTGGADGIGWATAQAFAQAGDRVVIADIDEVAAQQRASELGDKHLGLGCDVSQEEEVNSLMATISQHGDLDCVINNAGVGSAHLATTNQTATEFERVLRVNLLTAFLIAKGAYPMLARRGGAIVNLSSIAGLGGLPRRNAYGAAKAGIVAMTRSLACEWAGDNIRVNAVAPGYVETSLIRKLANDGSMDTDVLKRRIPLGRLGQPSDIASGIVFLCSPSASYITGVTLSIDGGWMAFAGPGNAFEDDP